MPKKPKKPEPRHPIQPLAKDAKGVVRFKANAIVQHLLDHGGIDMNAIAKLDFSQEDREQFAQLIGYSHGGSGELGYVSDEVWESAIRMYEDEVDEQEARNQVLRMRLHLIEQHVRDAAVVLFKAHPDDLEPR